MTTKEKVRDLVSRLPEDATLEDIQYHLYVLEAIEQGEQDVADGRTITHEEVERRFAEWLK